MLIVPVGALPASAEILIRRTCMPLLADDVEPIGDAVAIRCPDVPSRTLILSIPAPEGAWDPSEYVIIRVERDGTTTYLMTELVGENLIALTPGYGTFVLARLKEYWAPRLSGPDILVPGEVGTFATLSDWPLQMPEEAWSATAGTLLTQQGMQSAAVVALDQPDWGEVRHSFLATLSGVRWFGARNPAIVQGPEGYEGQPFKVSLSTDTPVTYAGREVTMLAKLHGAFEGPITWSWDFGDGESGGPVTTDEDVAVFELPAKRYDTEDPVTDYQVTVTARDALGSEVSGSASIRVFIMEYPYVLTIEGPLRLAWPGMGPGAVYTARATGQEPPHKYRLTLYPVVDRHTLDSGEALAQEFLFDQPGEHRIYGLATNIQDPNHRAWTTIRVLVGGREPLVAGLQFIPETGRPNEPIQALVLMRGGVLVVAGKKGGYSLTMDWGDGSPRQVGQDYGRDNSSLEMSYTSAVHTYSAPGTYTVSVEVCDATGWTAVASRGVTIAEPGATVSPTPTPTGTRPTATRTPTPTETDITPWPPPTDTHTPTPTYTNTPTNTPTPDQPGPGRLLVWVRQEPAVVNPHNAPLELAYTHPAVVGSITRMTASETRFTTREKYVYHGDMQYDLRITCDFHRPQLVLNPGSRYQVQANFSHQGLRACCGEGLGEQFWYAAQTGYEWIIDPREVLRYGPWSPTFTGTNEKKYMITAPPITHEGQTFDLYASLHNRPPCLVVWTYRAEYHGAPPPP